MLMALPSLSHVYHQNTFTAMDRGEDAGVGDRALKRPRIDDTTSIYPPPTMSEVSHRPKSPQLFHRLGALPDGGVGLHTYRVMLIELGTVKLVLRAGAA
jgi:hypothetical protein